MRFNFGVRVSIYRPICDRRRLGATSLQNLKTNLEADVVVCSRPASAPKAQNLTSDDFHGVALDWIESNI